MVRFVGSDDENAGTVGTSGIRRGWSSLDGGAFRRGWMVRMGPDGDGCEWRCGATVAGGFPDDLP